jgi:hypothetical protein
MPSPILPRSGLLDTPAASAADLSSAPTRSFRDVVVGGPPKSSAGASVQGRDAPVSLSQVETPVAIPPSGLPDTPSWALQPPPEFLSSFAASNDEDGHLPAPQLLSTSSTLPLDASSVFSPNVPVSALDSQALAAEFLHAETQNAPPATSSLAAAGSDRPAPSSFLSSEGIALPAAAGYPQPSAPSFPSLGGVIGVLSRAPTLLPPASASAPPLLPSSAPAGLAAASSSSQVLPLSLSATPGATPITSRLATPPSSVPYVSTQRVQPQLPQLPFSAVVAENPRSSGLPPSRPFVLSSLSSAGRSTPDHGPHPPSAADGLPRAPMAPVNTPPPQALQHRDAAAHQRRRLVLTPSAASMMLDLHNGEMDILQPLEGGFAAAFVENLQREALELFGLPLAPSMATTVMEVSRHLPGANGWPTLEEALACLRNPHAPAAGLPQQAAPTVNRPPPTFGNPPSILAERQPPPSAADASQHPRPPVPRFTLSDETLLRMQTRMQQDFLRSTSGLPQPPQAVHLQPPIAPVSQPRLPPLPGQLAIAPQPVSGHGLVPNAVPPSYPSLVNVRSPPPLPVPPPFPPSSSVSSSARFRRRTEGRAVGPISAPAPEPRDRCTSCGHRGHDALQCPEGLDVASVVDAAEHLEAAMRERASELSAIGNQEADLQDCEHAVRREAASTIADITGISVLDVTSVILESQDAGSTLVSAVCRARGGEHAELVERQCQQELSRRRRMPLLQAHSREAARASSPAAQYADLASRVNLASQLGYGYRVDTSGVQLPAFPSRPPVTAHRRRATDDLPGFVCDDHDSTPEHSPRPGSHRRRESSPRPRRELSPNPGENHRRDSPPHQRRRGRSSGSSDQSSSDRSDQSSRESTSDFSSESGSDEPRPRRSRSRRSSSGSDGSSSAGSDGSADSSDSASSRSRRDRPSDAARRDQVLDGPLTASALASLVSSLSKKMRDGNGNGMLASKPPSFWGLGKPPSGGYFPETFNRIYNEYRQFRSVFGSNTGLSFKRLITEEMQPTVRRDLKLTRRQFKKIDSSKLVSKLKKRLCFHKRDVYVAELEACPKIPPNIKDISALNVAFKDLSSKMLDVVERAHRHGVRLRKSSCKHILGQAVKNSYRLSQWFHLNRFKSIGDSVRRINTQLQRRLSTDAEKRHEQTADQAMSNGVRQQLGTGHVEGSSAPERPRKGGAAKSGPKGGISKNDNPRLSSEEYAKKMDALYRVENALEKGRHFHKHGPYCNSPTNCTLKFCQGCGEHQVEGKPWHDRPKCRARKHVDFVAAGYWHDKWPNRLSLRARPDTDADTRPQSSGKRSDTMARANHVGRKTAEAPEVKDDQ